MRCGLNNTSNEIVCQYYWDTISFIAENAPGDELLNDGKRISQECLTEKRRSLVAFWIFL
jgi:hypothetical protein